MKPKVAVIGLGRMGSAMARRIHGAGHELVVWNRDQTKADALAADVGASVATSPGAAAKEVEVVVTSLADDAAMDDVYLGEDGVVTGVTTGTLVADTSTVDPGTSRRVGAALAAAGARFCDCPVSGSVSSVESGALTIMAGGDEADVEALRPILSAFSAKVVHVGDVGAGSACKLAVNGLLHSLNVALCEALVLAERSGVGREAAYEVFASGAAGAPYVHYKREAFEHPESAAVAFTLDLVAKDLELITGLAEKVGAPVDQARVTAGIVDRAIASGMGHQDLSAVAIYLRERA